MAGVQQTATGLLADNVTLFPAVFTITVSGTGDVSISVPTNELWYPLGITTVYTTSATVGNRRLRLQYLDESSNCVGGMVVTPFLTASGVFHVSFGNTGGTSSTWQSNVNFTTFPTGYVLPGHTISLADMYALDTPNDAQQVSVIYIKHTR